MKLFKLLAIIALFCASTPFINAKRLVSGTTLDILGNNIIPLYHDVRKASDQLNNLLTDYGQKPFYASVKHFYASAEQANDSIDKAMKYISFHYKRYDAAFHPDKYKDEMFIQISYLIDEVVSPLQEAQNAISHAMEQNKSQSFFESTVRFFKRIFNNDPQSKLNNIKKLLDRALEILAR